MEIKNNVLIKVTDDDIVNGTFNIPNDVIWIGEKAFENCKSLISITIPENVTIIGDRAFIYCENLKTINIPNSITKIENGAFVDCSKLDNIILPNSVNKIDDHTFGGCKSLKTIYIPDSVTKIGDMAFYGCKSLKNIDIPNTITSIGDNAFSLCENLKSIVLPDSVTNIGFGVFMFCKSLEEIEFSNNIKYLQDATFESCKSLKKIRIPKNITYIGYNAFNDCPNLKEVIISSKAQVQFNAFERCPNANIIYKDIEAKKIKNENIAKVTNQPQNTPIPMDEFNTIMSEMQNHINNLKNLEIKPLNAENSMSIEKFGDELKDYPMLIINWYGSSANINKDDFKKDKQLRKIINQLDNKVSLFKKIGNTFLKKQDDEIILNKDDLNKLKNVFNRTLDMYYKQTEILECLKEMIELYIRKLDMCIQELYVTLQNRKNNDIDKIEINILNEYIRTKLNTMQKNKEHILNIYNQINYIISLNITRISLLNAIIGILSQWGLTEYKNNKLVIKKESIHDMADILHQLINIQNYMPKIDSQTLKVSLTNLDEFTPNNLEIQSPAEENIQKYTPKIHSQTPKAYPTNLDEFTPNNLEMQSPTEENIPYSLYIFGEKLGLLDTIKVIKTKIDTYLKNNNIADKQYFSYTKHEGFIREMLECINADPNYNYIHTLNNYMKYITDAISRVEAKEAVKTDEVAIEKNNKLAKDEYLKLKEETNLLKQQISSCDKNEDNDSEIKPKISLEKPRKI